MLSERRRPRISVPLCMEKSREYPCLCERRRPGISVLAERRKNQEYPYSQNGEDQEYPCLMNEKRAGNIPLRSRNMIGEGRKYPCLCERKRAGNIRALGAENPGAVAGNICTAAGTDLVPSASRRTILYPAARPRSGCA